MPRPFRSEQPVQPTTAVQPKAVQPKAVQPAAAGPAADEKPVLPAKSRDETDVGWGEPPDPDDEERLRRERPPHWDLSAVLGLNDPLAPGPGSSSTLTAPVRRESFTASTASAQRSSGKRCVMTGVRSRPAATKSK
jgi:hypothetical protein